MKLMKPAVTIFIIFAMMISIVACSSGNTKDNASNKPSTAPTQQVVSDDEEPVADINFNGRTIRIAMWWDQAPKPDTERGEKLVALQEEIEKKYNVKIEYLNVPYDEIYEKTTTSVLAGEPFADIVRLELKWAFPNLVEGKYIMPLDDFNLIHYDQIFTEGVKNVGSYKGNQYGFVDGFGKDAGIFYNKTMFKREGLEDLYELQEKGLWTWDKFMEISKKLTKDTNGSGKTNQFGVSAWDKILAQYLIASNGGHVVNAENGKVGFAEPNAVEALRFLDRMYNVDKVVQTEIDSSQAFTQGSVGMNIGWAWQGEGYKENMTDEFGYVFFPKGPKASDYAVNATGEQNHLYFVPAGVKMPGEVLRVWEELQIWEDKVNTDWLEKQFMNEESIDTALKMTDKTVLDNFEGYGNIGDLFSSMVGLISRGEEPADTAIAKTEPEAQAVLDSVLKK